VDLSESRSPSLSPLITVITGDYDEIDRDYDLLTVNRVSGTM